MSNLVVLRSYPDRLHAELARSFLEAEGIEAFVSSPSQLPGSYLIAEWGDGIVPHELKVVEEDLPAAEEALAETEAGDWAIDDDENPVPPPAPSVGESSALCPACEGDPENGDRAIVLSVKGAIWATGLYVAVALAFLPFTKPLNVWLALSILGMIIPVVLFVVRGFFVRARCGYCGQMRVPKAKSQ